MCTSTSTVSTIDLCEDVLSVLLLDNIKDINSLRSVSRHYHRHVDRSVRRLKLEEKNNFTIATLITKYPKLKHVDGLKVRTVYQQLSACRKLDSAIIDSASHDYNNIELSHIKEWNKRGCFLINKDLIYLKGWYSSVGEYPRHVDGKQSIWGPDNSDNLDSEIVYYSNKRSPGGLIDGLSKYKNLKVLKAKVSEPQKSIIKRKYPDLTIDNQIEDVMAIFNKMLFMFKHKIIDSTSRSKKTFNLESISVADWKREIDEINRENYIDGIWLGVGGVPGLAGVQGPAGPIGEAGVQGPIGYY